MKNHKLSFLILLYLIPSIIFAQMDQIMSMKKIDVHTHISSDAEFFKQFLDDYNMKVNTLCTGGLDTARLHFRINGAKEFCNKNPRYYAWITSFDLTDLNDPDWSRKVIIKLKEDFDTGAIGVKIWKEIGMTIKDSKGKYIMVDDPMFDPIFEFIAQEGKTVIAHLGEPIQAWMPDHPESSGKPMGYWGRHPEFSFWDNPELPSYNDIMAARDHLLAKHPNLRFVGAHLGSLEYDVDEIAKRLETYPNFAVEIGGRMRYLMWQARGKVRQFFIEFQDRIMYGTDLAAGEIIWKSNSGYNSGGYSTKATKEEKEKILERWNYRQNFFLRYLATDDEFPWGNQIIGDIPLPEATYTVRGLALPREILKKVLYDNAVKWFPGIDKDF